MPKWFQYSSAKAAVIQLISEVDGIYVCFNTAALKLLSYKNRKNKEANFLKFQYSSAKAAVIHLKEEIARVNCFNTAALKLLSYKNLWVLAGAESAVSIQQR